MMLSKHIQLGWVAASIVLVSAAQLLLKLAAQHIDIITFATVIAALATRNSIYLISGLCCYLISMACWLKALEKLPLSTTYPLLALSYPLVYLGALALPSLHETFNMLRLSGMLLIMLGIVLLAPRASTRFDKK